MRYVPARCEACCVVNLVLEQSCSQGEAVCPECRTARAFVLPGCSYSVDDLPVFHDLRAVLEKAELSAAEAGELVLIMDSLSNAKDDQRTFSNLVEHLPALASALSILTAHPEKLRQALTLLTTLIQDRAFSRISGMLELPGEMARYRA